MVFLLKGFWHIILEFIIMVVVVVAIVLLIKACAAKQTKENTDLKLAEEITKTELNVNSILDSGPS